MKTFLLFCLLIGIGLMVKAQENFTLGPRVGYNSNRLSDNMDSIQTAIDNSFQIGAFLRLGSKTYFQPEINYQVINGNMHKTIGASLLSQDIIIRTIKIPALIGTKLVDSDKVNLRVMAGPAVTFLFNKKLDPDHIDELWPIQTINDLKNSIWSVQLGAGLDVLFMTLDVRYELGVDNIYNGNSELKMHNNIFNVSLGIKLL
jgi:hypothetical protein